MVFQSKTFFLMQQIANLDRKRKELEAQDKEMRAQLAAAMEKCGIQQFENRLLKITHIAPSTRETVDAKRLKAELPEIAEKYIKVSSVKGSVRITVKE